ncbi:MAG: hypothetical protein OEL87_02880, partial [Nanoarchaeota archaeon]|nr:hypothetical protein [Nanoarchaeota archaeon]
LPEEEMIEKAEEDDEAGIFDEDLKESDDKKSDDFSVADTILSTATSVPSWQGQNLEEAISRERVQRDWADDSEFVGSDIYSPESRGNLYTESQSTGGLYQEGGSGQDLYEGSRQNGDLYNTGKDGSKGSGAAEYATISRAKSHDEIMDNRRSGRSILEIAGFEDAEKQKQRDTRTHQL